MTKVKKESEVVFKERQEEGGSQGPGMRNVYTMII